MDGAGANQKAEKAIQKNTQFKMVSQWTSLWQLQQRQREGLQPHRPWKPLKRKGKQSAYIKGQWLEMKGHILQNWQAGTGQYLPVCKLDRDISINCHMGATWRREMAGSTAISGKQQYW